ncbi:MAG: sigma-54 dependent transcriptional regulator [Candidatus Electrothrix aestuarii]|uniref:Sigma-54 dependent transcriptional regulator n=1 Tax=Candidatus Electrothrix aestuarii TaxID=3062594 RepID=A0AAU8LXF3_9BACT|nr:sigma-54 dependent transcriptional regulator [Candidatus Electrothrix aestuarii]
MPSTILIIDDEAPIREVLSGILSDEGFHPLSAASAEEGLTILAEQDVHLVLLDIWLPGMDGIAALEKIKQDGNEVPVIMISGHGTIETAVQATRIGAFDFIEKPLSYDKVVLAINQGLRVARLERENKLLREAKPSEAATAIIGDSPVVKHLRMQIERVAPTDASVLILGGHGTGKELVAQAIHSQSNRAESPMVEVNCAAIPEELIESELFGYEKGAFTGADKAKKGKFDQAHGSTLFLDEIGDMSLKSQAKVLRILQEQKFERVGGAKTIEVDVRILAATNKNLEQEIEEGNFRADLFYRLNVVPIQLPDLKERLEDIPALVGSFLERFRSKGLGEKRFAGDALSMLMQHPWPGNIRELRNMVERLMIMVPGELITAKEVAVFLNPSDFQPLTSSFEAGYSHLAFKDARKQFEHDYLKKKLEENEGNVSKTAETIGMERSHLHKKVKALGIKI